MRILAVLLAAALLLPGLACAQSVPNTFGVGVAMPDLGKLDANFAALTGTRTSINNWAPVFAARGDSSATPATAGSGYAIGDVLILNDGCTAHAAIAVRTVSTGAIATYNLTDQGTCTALPNNPVSVLSTTGSGTGATFNMSWAPYSAFLAGETLAQGGDLFIGMENHQQGLYGQENVHIGDRSGGMFTGNSGFNVVVGHNSCGIGGGTPFTGNNNTCVGTDAGRNIKNGTGIAIFGTSALKTQTNASGNIFTAFGAQAMMNLDSGNSNNNSNAFGSNACLGAAGASFRGVTCLGSNTGAVLSSAVNSLLIGNTTGNTVFASGTGVVLIGSGNQTVTTPAAGTSNWMNIENSYRASTVAPTVSSGFGTSPTIPAGTSTAAFQVNVGTGGTASSGVVAFATAAPTGWACAAVDGTNSATANTVVAPTSTTTVTLTNYSRTTGALTAWAASDIITVACNGF